MFIYCNINMEIFEISKACLKNKKLVKILV